jgi:hypothetical protein
MAETRYRGAAAGIQIAPAVAVDDLDPLAAHRDRIVVLGLPAEHVLMTIGFLPQAGAWQAG